MTTVPPPDVPHLTGFPPALQEYLRRLTQWAASEIDKKVSTDTATPGILLLPTDVKPPSTVYKITVDHLGALHTVQMPLGQGKP